MYETLKKMSVFALLLLKGCTYIADISYVYCLQENTNQVGILFRSDVLHSYAP